MLASTTNLDKYYQLLGLPRGASLNQLKTSYRLLARQWHPDLNPGNIEAPQRFIALNQAYQILLTRLSSPSPQFTPQPVPAAVPTRSPDRPTTNRPLTNRHRVPQPAAPIPVITNYQAELKWKLSCKLQLLIEQEQFLQAIFVVEGLAQYLPHDLQIPQWQGMIYAKFGSQLIKRRKFNKARIYFTKALRVDPHNQHLATIVDRAFTQMTRLS
jgi:tetratricopeptide (TPR) repeat protein